MGEKKQKWYEALIESIIEELLKVSSVGQDRAMARFIGQYITLRYLLEKIDISDDIKTLMIQMVRNKLREEDLSGYVKEELISLIELIEAA